MISVLPLPRGGSIRTCCACDWPIGLAGGGHLCVWGRTLTVRVRRGWTRRSHMVGPVLVVQEVTSAYGNVGPLSVEMPR